ncbi:hypothetical protein BDQ17DRAFT_1432704 [Cyathus striatus]|nr:hypothetical protein BDQ17DRAFT_1432704 [Cyathus striatus]
MVDTYTGLSHAIASVDLLEKVMIVDLITKRSFTVPKLFLQRQLTLELNPVSHAVIWMPMPKNHPFAPRPPLLHLQKATVTSLHRRCYHEATPIIFLMDCLASTIENACGLAKGVVGCRWWGDVVQKCDVLDKDGSFCSGLGHAEERTSMTVHGLSRPLLPFTQLTWQAVGRPAYFYPMTRWPELTVPSYCLPDILQPSLSSPSGSVALEYCLSGAFARFQVPRRTSLLCLIV